MICKSGFIRYLLPALIILSVGCAETNKLRKENTSLNEDLETVIKEKEKLANDCASKEAEIARLIQDRNSLIAQRSSLQTERNRLRAERNSLKTKRVALNRGENNLEKTRYSMEKRLRGTGTTVKIKEGKITVELPSSIYFKSGQAILIQKAKSSLKKVSNVIKSDFPNETIRIEGHTDNDPIKKTKKLYASNWELSAMRAATVLHFLIDEGNLDPKKLYIAGFGEYQPIASNKSKDGKKKNRRVEIVVLKNDSNN